MGPLAEECGGGLRSCERQGNGFSLPWSPQKGRCVAAVLTSASETHFDLRTGRRKVCSVKPLRLQDVTSATGNEFTPFHRGDGGPERSGNSPGPAGCGPPAGFSSSCTLPWGGRDRVPSEHPAQILQRSEGGKSKPDPFFWVFQQTSEFCGWRSTRTLSHAKHPINQF